MYRYRKEKVQAYGQIKDQLCQQLARPRSHNHLHSALRRWIFLPVWPQCPPALHISHCILSLFDHKQYDHASIEQQLLHSKDLMGWDTEEAEGEILQIHLPDRTWGSMFD
uniref:Uncharacterized protein n=1 Tax=Rhizophora mucronata TaxID=61149 RepID=A0A2P2L3V4_RHIMU